MKAKVKAPAPQELGLFVYQKIIVMRGFYTEKERKQKFKYDVFYFRFSSNWDLSGGITVTPRIGEKRITHPLLAYEVMSFTAWWIRTHYEHLNGFSGFDAVSWGFTAFESEASND